ncbi:Psi-producing oxygenase A [Golovinomyces cichoracearum]|uniref:Psi-producing oxygenase A n=1 Tax=Golovinomyces cichoracearum TaxID=62708 RepID=A0A420J8A2_9PEZI|nr:Psi-producing oxygenase A [Golovinomyces cichoracearum]
MPKAYDYLADLRKLGFKDIHNLFLLLSSEIKGEQDDNKFILENLIKILAKWDESSKLGEKLSNVFIGGLWNALEHPPNASIGSQYMYRAADGGCNNISLPDLGRAGTPYARNAKPVRLQNVALPDPGVIFDSLMSRGEKFDPHPNKISSMLFYLGTIIIHDIFRTDHKDFNISNASSYLDLAPLYGSNQAEQNYVRTFKDGKLKPDCFSEKRVLGFPPGVGVMLIMFNRFHNHVVSKLAAINENMRFRKPADLNAEQAWIKYDNDLFQTGRLITCGLYVNCVLKDYVRTILNLNRTKSKWNLDPRSEEGKSIFSKPVPQGVGNQVSAEFNVIYRWHSVISERDDRWTQDKYAEMFSGKDPEQVTLEELLQTLGRFEKEIPSDPLERKFANLTRNPDGTYQDDDLVNILEASICDIASSYGANRIPRVLRSVEILGMIQSRAWNTASLNEFREASGLTKHKTFEDINPDRAVAEKLRNLYDHPDSVELYAGLIAEKAKPPMSPGSGLCVNFTTSYSILADAVSLVRGDRFYTTDYTAKRLTNWGFKEVLYDTSIDEGCVFYKLILEAFPRHFKDNSIYAHFPFVIPEENLKIQKSLHREDKYSWEKPTYVPEPVMIKSHDTALTILCNETNWKFIGNHKIYHHINQSSTEQHLKSSPGGNLSHEASKTLFEWPAYPNDLDSEVKKFFQETSAKLLKKFAYEIPGKNANQVDIVRDVSNLVAARFVASIFNIPIMTEDKKCEGEAPSDQELYKSLSILYHSIVYSHDTSKSFELREAALETNRKLGEQIVRKIKADTCPCFMALFKARSNQNSILSSYGKSLIKGMLEANQSIKDIVWNYILPTAACMMTSASQAFCNSLDFYLGENSKHLPDIYECSLAGTQEADEKLERYFMEGLRLSSTNGVYRDYQPDIDAAQSTTTIKDGISEISISAGQRIFVDVRAASRDPNVLPDPDEVILTRPLDSYLRYYFGPLQHKNLATGKDLGTIAMTAMFKCVFGLKGLRRAQGSGPNGSWIWGESQGEMKLVKISSSQYFYMTPDQDRFCPFPTTMKIHWDRNS